MLSTLTTSTNLPFLSRDYFKQQLQKSWAVRLGHQQVASKFSPSIIELQKFCQTWWLLKVQLLLALIVMTWALVLLALQ